MSQIRIFGEIPGAVVDGVDDPEAIEGTRVGEWEFVDRKDQVEKGIDVPLSDISADITREQLTTIIERLGSPPPKKIAGDGKEYDGSGEAPPQNNGGSDDEGEISPVSVDVPLVSASEVTGQHWTLDGGVSGLFGTRRQAVASFGLPENANAGENVGVVIVDVGLNREYVNGLGSGDRYGGGWRPALESSRPAGLYDPGKYQNPSGRMSSGHGNMIARNVLSLAPKATLYDAPILPERVLDFPAFSSHARGILNGVLGVITKQLDNQSASTDGEFIPIEGQSLPPHDRWIIVNAWAVATSFADIDGVLSYADNRLHRMNKTITNLAKLENVEVVFAAGNSGAFQPARFAGPYDRGHARSIWGANGLEEVHTIGAVRTDGLSVGASSQGPSRSGLLTASSANGAVNQKPNFCAPSWFSEDDDRSVINTGTSAACAMYAGYLAATVKDLTVSSSAEVKNEVKTTASRQNDWDPQRGHGTVKAPVASGA